MTSRIYNCLARRGGFKLQINDLYENRKRNVYLHNRIIKRHYRRLYAT